MKRSLTILIFILALSLLLGGCGGEKELGEWQMPELEAAPTVQPTAMPVIGGSKPAENYVWNEGEKLNMSDPGVGVPASQKELTHAETLALFGGQFLPKTIFDERYGAYERMYLEQVKHNVLLDGAGALPENAYVEYRYLNKAWVEAGSITVMAELCSYERAQELFSSGVYPHMSYAEGTKPVMSSYYLNQFILTKIGETRYAQWLAMPEQYLSYIQKAEQKAEEAGTEPEIPRVPLLTFTCREKVTDEQFIAAVREIGQACAGSITLPDLDAPKLPKPGEKGAA